MHIAELRPFCGGAVVANGG